MMKIALVFAISIAVIASTAHAQVPPIPREFRAVWVGNIDWPSRPGLSTEEQKAEALKILDRCSTLNLNAVILQVRTSADALYHSPIEPWSAFLTGVQGRAPEPYYDPLAFWLAESHARGLQLHAWLNPYRARYQGAKYEEAASHVAQARPDLVKPYGGMLWLDPGEPDSADLTLRVVADIVKRYDIDGIHVDDYFYPYPVPDPADKTKELDFPDGPSWDKYRNGGGPLLRADWRRSRINDLMERMYRTIKAEKRHVLFGVSPFGIPRPGHPAMVKGFDQFEKLYADAEHWLRDGWCDYWTPQLYWKLSAPEQPFRPLLEYWVAANTKGRHVWPGLIPSRIGDGPKGYDPSEILDQIAVTRGTEGASGHVHFSMKAFIEDRKGLDGLLMQGPYRKPALVPTSPWLGDTQGPPTPKVEVAAGLGEHMVRAEISDEAFLIAVQVHKGDGWAFDLIPVEPREDKPATPGGKTIWKFPIDYLTPDHESQIAQVSEIAISTVDRLGNVSPPSVWRAAPAVP